MTRKALLFTMYITLYYHCFWSGLVFANAEPLALTLMSNKHENTLIYKEFNAKPNIRYRLLTTELYVDGKKVPWARPVEDSRIALEGYDPASDDATDLSCILGHPREKDGSIKSDSDYEHCIFDPDAMVILAFCSGGKLSDYASYIIIPDSPIAECQLGQTMRVSLMVKSSRCGQQHEYQYNATVEEIPS